MEVRTGKPCIHIVLDLKGHKIYLYEVNVEVEKSSRGWLETDRINNKFG